MLSKLTALLEFEEIASDLRGSTDPFRCSENHQSLLALCIMFKASLRLPLTLRCRYFWPICTFWYCCCQKYEDSVEVSVRSGVQELKQPYHCSKSRFRRYNRTAWQGIKMGFYELEQCIQDFERCSEGGIVSSNVQDDVIRLFFKDWNNVVMVISYVAPGRSCTLTSLFNSVLKNSTIPVAQGSLIISSPTSLFHTYLDTSLIFTCL